MLNITHLSHCSPNTGDTEFLTEQADAAKQIVIFLFSENHCLQYITVDTDWKIETAPSKADAQFM